VGLKADAPWPIVGVELWQTQVAFAIGLLGIYGGWKGTISKMTGFYDLAGAVKHLVYGIVVGMLLAVFVDSMILSSIIMSYINIFGAFSVALLIAAAESAFVLFLISRSRTASLRASPPFGWALGLGIGSMQACVLIFRLFDNELAYSDYSGVNVISLSLAIAIALCSCLGHALLGCWQGAEILESRRLRPFVMSSVYRATLTICLVLSLFTPVTLLAVLTGLWLAWGKAQSSWLPSGMTPAAKQAYRRTTRQSDRHREASTSRIRGENADSDE
tara:strand:+ start:1203 stop:2024 length:822 start_codon:yes stop_codon:yes gene_type:complete